MFLPLLKMCIQKEISRTRWISVLGVCISIICSSMQDSMHSQFSIIFSAYVSNSHEKMSLIFQRKTFFFAPNSINDELMPYERTINYLIFVSLSQENSLKLYRAYKFFKRLIFVRTKTKLLYRLARICYLHLIKTCTLVPELF